MPVTRGRDSCAATAPSPSTIFFSVRVPLSLQHARRAIALYLPEDFHTVTYGFGPTKASSPTAWPARAAWCTGPLDEGIALTYAAVQLGRTLSLPHQ